MSAQLLLEDAANRKRALDLASFIVEAPAGAGKTELLTQRYLKLLQTVNTPEEIIAITFTNKAAAEMRLRILDSLMTAANHTPPTLPHKQITYDLSLKALEHAQTHNWQLIENPSRLRIFTIDSLCAHLARQMPLLSRFGAQPKVADDADILYAQAADQTLALLEHTEYGDIVKTALRYVENNAAQLSGLLINMLQKRDQWLGYSTSHHEIDAAQLQSTLRYLIEKELESVSHAFNSNLQHELMPLARFAAGHLNGSESIIRLLNDWNAPLATYAEALPMWLSVRELLLTNENSIRAKIDKNIGFKPEYKIEKANFKAYLESLETMPNFAENLAKLLKLSTFSATLDSWQMIAALSKLLNLAVAQLWLVFQIAGEVDFVEISQRATQALGAQLDEPTDLALKLDYQIQHLLVDEFQDTSPSQIKLLEQLTMGWQSNDNRTLFCVGDPMQSVYRFRKANVSLFINAANHGIGNIHLQRLQLYRNNRSTPQIVNWINKTFAPLFADVDDANEGAIAYRPSIADANKNVSDSGVEIHAIIQYDKSNTDSAKQREAEAVIDLIERERRENPNAKIAVLVSAKNHLAPLVSTLRRLHSNIPFQALDIEALKNRQVVQDLLALTHALYHKADRVHWLAILRAPWCGLSLADLHALAGSNHHAAYNATIWQLMQNEDLLQTLSADGRLRLLHVRAIFSEAFQAQGRMPTSRWLRSVWLMLNGNACLWEQSDVVDVQAFFGCLDALDKRNQFSPERMVIEIEKLFAAPDAQGENLQMMTIHKSKGLEFDTVIMLGLGNGTGGNHDDAPLLLWEEVLIDNQNQLIAAPYVPKSLRDKETVTVYDFLALREKIRDANENARKLYVAATRAERKLHLVGFATKNKDGDIKPAANTPLALLWPAVSQCFEGAETPSNVDTIEDDIANFTPQLVRLKQLQIPAALQSHQHETVATTTSKNTAPNNAIATPNLAADLGTLAHLYMEMIAKTGLEQWPASRIDACSQSMQFWLLQRGHAKNDVEKQVIQVINALKRTITSPEGAWILASRASSQTELSISTTDSEQRIDMTFIDNADLIKTRWIIDYKLGLDVTEMNANAAALAHKPQLAGYAGLFTHENLPIRIAVFFLSLGKLIEV